MFLLTLSFFLHIGPVYKRRLAGQNLFTNGKSIPFSELKGKHKPEPVVVPFVAGFVVVAVRHTAVLSVVVERAATQYAFRAFGLALCFPYQFFSQS